MTFRPITDVVGAMLRPALLCLPFVTLMLPTAGQAQSAACRQIESELAALGRGGAAQGGAYARQAAGFRQRLGQVQGTMASLGCERGFVLFGPQPPAQCSSLKAEASSLRASIAQYEGASRQVSAGNPQRRAQLLAALDANNCRGARSADTAAMAPPPQPRRPRGFFETLFGVDPAPNYATETMPGPGEELPPVDPKLLEAKKSGGGGPLAVCVRTCDGFFFPVNYQGADGEYEEVCKASCPGADAELYWMQAGGDLDSAKTEDGKRYTALPAAFSYRKSYDPSCSCKGKDQTWASVLQQADRLVRDRRNDITVTEARSDEMARPKQQVKLRGVKAGAAEPADNGEAKLNTDFATNGTAKAGIGPEAEAARILGTGDGETREVNGKTGAKKQVRVLTPLLSTAQQ